MATAKGYVTPEQVAAALGYRTDDTALMEGVELVLTFVENDVEQYCQQSFVRRDGQTRTYNGSGLSILDLGRLVRNVSSVKAVSSTGQTADLTQWSLQPRPPVREDDEGVPLYSYLQLPPGIVFPEGLGNIEVTGDWGVTALPAAIERAIILAVKHYFDTKQYDDTKAMETGFGRTVAFKEGVDYLPTISKRLLSIWKYRGGSE